jgi:hypothetical protein
MEGAMDETPLTTKRRRVPPMRLIIEPELPDGSENPVYREHQPVFDENGIVGQDLGSDMAPDSEDPNSADEDAVEDGEYLATEREDESESSELDTSPSSADILADIRDLLDQSTAANMSDDGDDIVSDSSSNTALQEITAE